MAMPGVAKCREHAALKLVQAERDPRHKRKLIDAAQAWLLLASRLEELEQSMHHRRAKVR